MNNPRENTPSPKGRDPKLQGDDGRFVPGNPGGPGNPFQRRTLTLRRLVMEAVSEADVKEVVAELVKLAKSGDLAAIKELFDRLMGRPKAPLETEEDDEPKRPIAEVVAECLAVLKADKPEKTDAAGRKPKKPTKPARRSAAPKKPKQQG